MKIGTAGYDISWKTSCRIPAHRNPAGECPAAPHETSPPPSRHFPSARSRTENSARTAKKERYHENNHDPAMETEQCHPFSVSFRLQLQGIHREPRRFRVRREHAQQEPVAYHDQGNVSREEYRPDEGGPELRRPAGFRRFASGDPPHDLAGAVRQTETSQNAHEGPHGRAGRTHGGDVRADSVFEQAV